MSLDKGGRTSIESGFKVTMDSRDRAHNIQKNKEAAKKNLKCAEGELVRLGIDINAANRVQGVSSYVEKVEEALKTYITAKNHCDTFSWLWYISVF